MKVIKAGFEILNATPDLELTLERCGRVCYKSEGRIEEGSADKFISRLKNVLKHESVLEHGAITVLFTNDRGVSHEEVRHRIASFSQESTRYCNYSKDQFGNEITVIDIRGGFPEMTTERVELWRMAMLDAERYYFAMLKAGATPQEARSVLPNSLKTDIVITANPREWMHIFKMRCDKAAHPQIREVMQPCQAEFAKRWPALFADL